MKTLYVGTFAPNMQYLRAPQPHSVLLGGVRAMVLWKSRLSRLHWMQQWFHDEADAVVTRDESPSPDEQHRLLLARCLELRLLRKSDGGWHPGIIGYDLALSSRSNCAHCKTQFDATTGKIEKGSGRWRYWLAQRGRPDHYLHLKCTHSIVDRTQIENSVGFLLYVVCRTPGHLAR